jgi:predicted Zn-dependent protease
MQGLKWEFAVINSPEVNAFVVPGGKVVVYSGLLKLLKTDDELAAVIAHEAGHIVARHVAERLTQGSVVELLRCIAYYAFGVPIPSGPLTAVFFLPNSRKAETEADVIGLQLAARACYDPAAAAVVFSKLGEEEAKHGGSSAIPKMLRTHPLTLDRIKKINEMLPKAQLLKEAAGCNVGMLDAFERQVRSSIGGGW